MADKWWSALLGQSGPTCGHRRARHTVSSEGLGCTGAGSRWHAGQGINITYPLVKGLASQFTKEIFT